MSEQEVLQEIIVAYRQLISERYAHSSIIAQYDIPAAFTETRTAMVRDYFLNHLYPSPEKRAELEKAFQDLDNYIKNPEKLLRIILDSGSLLFKYGRDLPGILQAGLRALKSFRSATALEKKLVQTALDHSMQPPYSSENIKTLLAVLSAEEIEDFIQNNEALFKTLQDRKLVKKVLEIIGHLLAKMRKKPNIYTAEQVNALTVGYHIIQQGDLLFDQLSKTEQEQILAFVLQMERDFLGGLK